ncbi:hypothetical protein JCM30566_11250 [Marinitoga arctica]
MILAISFFKIIIIYDNKVIIINPSIYPKFNVINDNSFFSGYGLIKSFTLNNTLLIYFESFGEKIIFNNSNYSIVNQNVVLLYEKNLKKFSQNNIVINTQLKIDNIKNILIFFEKHNLKLPKEIYIFKTNYNQSFFIPKNYFFINNANNGIILHELSHYNFGYIIKRKNTTDIWPEIMCESFRLKYLKDSNIDLYNHIISNYKKRNDIYSKVLDYPLIIDYFDEFFMLLSKYSIISDNTFFNLYSTLKGVK